MENSSVQNSFLKQSNEWRETLFDTLKGLWQNYLDTEPLDVKAKEHWIHLFLFYYQYVDDDPTFKSDEFQRFFNSIPEQICSFLLQHIYTVVCQTVPNRLHKQNSNNHEDQENNIDKHFNAEATADPPVCSSTKQFSENHNFSELILDTPSDCNKVVALRNFLTDELGHHLLEFLLKVDIKLIASQKGLCNLCINLFPHCAWKLKTNTTPLSAPKKVLEFVGDFYFHEFNKLSRNINNLKRRTREAKSQKSDSRTIREPHFVSHLEDACNKFKAARKTSDEIAYMVVKLLIKSAANECEAPLSEQSMSVVLLKFALSKMPETEKSGSNFSIFDTNVSIIKCALLQLIELCLNNIFADDVSVTVMDFRYVLKTLSESYPSKKLQDVENTVERLLIHGLNFIIFGTIHNLTVIESRSKEPTNLEQFAQFNGLSSDKLMNIMKICETQILEQIKQPFIDEETCVIYGSIINVLAKIIENIQKVERHHNTNTNSLIGCNDGNGIITGSSNGICPRPRRRRYFNLQQTHCTTHFLTTHSTQTQTQTVPIRCFFQSLMLELQTVLPQELQEHNLRYWLRVGICCCHYTLARVGQFLSWISAQTPMYQRYTYKFLQRKILSAIFARPLNENHQLLQAKRRTTFSTAAAATIAGVHCFYCDEKSNSLEYHLGLLAQYRKLYFQIAESVELAKQPTVESTEYTRFSLFLQHLKDIAVLLPNDIAVGILAEIVLPIFRQHKMNLIELKQQIQAEEKGNFLGFWQTPRQDTQNLNQHNIEHSRAASLHLRTLSECLSIFVVYLTDIRRIKAFYNEENIQHLEDLITEPELVCGICELIRIGIENVTFLGDNAREQTNLSRHLISLQLKSSKRVAKQFDEILRRLSKFVPPLKTTTTTTIDNNVELLNLQVFWLDSHDNNDKNIHLEQNVVLTTYKRLTPLDILKNTALLWSLNNELLRRSQLFYNEFSKKYSDSNDNSNDDADTIFDDNNNNNMLDILKLNFNALSCFLLIGSRKKPNVTTNFHEVPLLQSNTKEEEDERLVFTTTSPPPLKRQPNEVYKIDDYFFSSLDTTLEHVYSPLPITHVTTMNDIENNNKNKHSIVYNNTKTLKSTLLQRLLSPTTGDLVFDKRTTIFDIQNCFDVREIPPPTTSCCKHIIFQNSKLDVSNLSNDFEFLNNSSTTESGLTTSTTKAAANIASEENSESVIGKLFAAFGSMLWFRLGSLYSLADLIAQQKEDQQEIEVDNDLKGFFNPQSDCKKLLLKIFESTMAICIKSYQNEKAEKMEKYLQKLKAIILSNAFTNWQQYSEESTRENAILQALQILLQTAEVSNTPNEQIMMASVTAGSDTNGRLVNNNCNNIVANDSDNAFPESLKKCLNDIDSSNRRQSATSSLLITTTSPATTRHHHTSPLECVSDNSNSHASHISTESDVDLSENDREPNDFSPADEGYEADGEIPEITDSDPNAAEPGITLWNQLQPTSRYRTYVLHKGLCHLIVSIMIELTQKCTLSPCGWGDSLALLGKRLFVIRDSLGGSQFLLQSFKSLLECNDTRLKELQQSILELITDLNTPETLCTLFNILTAKTPPVEIIIRHMHNICSNTVRKAQPFVELEFPVAMDGNCVSTGDPVVTERIDRIRNYHLHSQAVTPFTRAPCLIPIVHSKLWNNDGFSLTMWFQVKSMLLSHKASSNNSQLIDEDVRSSSTDDGAKTHIASIGTNTIMLSIFLSNTSSLSFEIVKPNGVIQQCSPSVVQPDETPIANSNCFENNRASHTRNSQQHTIQNTSAVLDTSTTLPSTINKLEQGTTPSTFRNALKQTKQVLLNSFSNIIHGPHDGAGGGGFSSDAYFESAATLKNCRLQPNKWTHLAMTVDLQHDNIELFVYIDGLEHQKVSLPCRNVRNLMRSHAFQLIALGDSNFVTSRSVNNSTNYNESQCSFDCTPLLRIGFSNLMLFNRPITNIEYFLNLAAMGPDFVDLIPCQIVDRRPNFGYLNLTKMSRYYFGNFTECMRALKEMRVLIYTAQQPDLVIGYDSIPAPTQNILYGSAFGLILYGELAQHHLQSLQTATSLCGGLSALLYLFARTVEATSNAITQSLALDMLLNVALSDSTFYADFIRNDYFSLIGYVIKTERCSKDVHLLRSIVNNACAQPLIHRKAGDMLYVNENTTTVLVYPRLLISILQRYSDWHRSGTEHSDVLDMLFQCLLALTREKHPQRNFNMEQLNNAGLFQALLNLCKVYLIESPNPVFISKYAAKLYVEIIAVFAGAPATPSLMDEIMKLLLLLHKPSECYITHDRSKFFFLLSSQPPSSSSKETTIGAAANLYRVAAPFRRNFGRAAVPVTNSINPNTINSETLDPKNRMRLNRIKKIHELNLPPYRRPLRELEENLENVADCSKLNKNALRLVHPIQASKWISLLKRHVQWNFHITSKERRNSVACPIRLYETRTIKHKRTRSKAITSSKSFSSINNRKRDLSKVYHCTRNSLSASESLGLTFDGSFGGDESAVDLHFSDVVRGVPTSIHRRHKAILKTDFYRSQGIMTLQEGLYKLLKDFLCLLPDNVVDEVLKHYIKVEILIVLSNNSSCAVRSAILRLLSALFQRLSANDLLGFSKNFYQQHLANQISIHPTDAQMFEACLEWVFGIYGGTDNVLNSPDLNLHMQQRFGVNTLLAIAAKLTTQQIEYAEKAFRLLNKIFHCETDPQFLIENGLLQCSVKALHNLYSKSNVVLVNAMTENTILDLIIAVGEYALKSVGHMNIVWDILNMLAFYQENQPAFVIKAFRSVQSQVQLSWINMFFGEKNGATNFKVSPLGNSSSPLTLSETKTRFGLLIDRSCQFFTVFDAIYTPSDYEIQLFELLVSYCISTNQRCNNFIAWGLQPTRPYALRVLIINTLWSICQDDFQPSIICDGKMIKSLLWLCLWEDLEQPFENLHRLCKHLAIDENDSAWNIEAELDRFKINRCTMSAKQKSLLEKTVNKFESLAVGCIESSMVTTRRVAELQNAERKLLMSHMKDYDETTTYTKWLEIIRRMTHEGAPWYCKERYENSWELDDTEGPSRVHTRLRHCHLDIDKRFVMPEYDNSTTAKNKEGKGGEYHIEPSSRYSSASLRSLSDYIRPLDYLISSYDQQLNISLNSQILYNFPAKYLPVDGEIDGEIIITDHKLYFLATYRCKYFYVTCDISNISEIWIKRYQHQEKAFEIFLDTNKSLFFSLQNYDDWKIMRDIFCDKIISQPDQTKILLITQQWREGLFTNWEYLMTLNQIAGRTYNDLMQYPVFPWILSNYNTEILDLTDTQNFRKLEKPIAIQHEANEQHYINNYTYINNTMTNMGSLVLKPYHYSSHYSNSGTVLHFLVRVPPFTSYFLRYQDNNFDLPDRTFHALNTTWNLASRDSPTDVKELIPEFFCLPEMFENFERFNFGCRQNGERVDNVLLPPWCYRDSRLFVLIHRQALECEVVRRGLHHWIDLIFGFKQTGESAVEAVNVFHPATYSTFMESEILDPIERRAVETMVKTYGQMPRQLFKSTHPASKSLNYCLVQKSILQSVRGLRWGVYLGSPQLPLPSLGNIHKLPGAEYLVCFSNTNVIYGLPGKSCVMQGIESDTYNVVSWGHNDRIVRIQSLNKPQAKLKNLLYNVAFDEITVCGTDPNSNQLWFGHRSGRITVYKCLGAENNQRTTKGRQSYVRGLRLSYNSAFRKMTTSTTSSTSDAQMTCSSGITDITGGGSSNITSPSSSSAASLTGHTSAELLQQRDVNDGPDLNWIGPTVLIRHTDEITSICLSVEFKIAVSAGRDGLAVIWDLNDWSYVRTIQRPTEIHHSPITLIAISPTLGDIVTVHTIPKTENQSTNEMKSEKQFEKRNSVKTPKNTNATIPTADECFEVTEESLDDFVNVLINPNGKSMLRLHTVNARYVQHLLQEEQIHAVCYSYIKEGVGVNVVATAIEAGIIRLWSSWNLNFVCEIVTGISNIKSIAYSTHQHLVVLTKEAHIQVWETEGLYGSAPKFPQISYK